MKSFNEFVDKKQREAVRQLEIIKNLLAKEGMKVEDYADTKEPYVFVHKTNEELSFDGLRIYNIGGVIAYRVQKEKNTHPYGKAYSLDIEEMYNDLLTDKKDAKAAVQEIIKVVPKELKKFFEESAEAEESLNNQSDDGFGKTVIKSGGTDYSNMISGSNGSN